MSDPIDSEIVTTPDARQKAYKLRKKREYGAELTEEESEFLRDYERDRPEKSLGARASRKVSYTEEEHAAVGTGDAARGAVEGFGLAAMSREEGRRLDHVLQQSIGALVRACDLHEKMAKILLQERVQDAAANRSLLESVRTHFLARTEAEAELQYQQREPEKDSVNEMAAQLLPVLLAQLSGGKNGKSQ